MATFISHSPGETEALGEAWGRAAPAGLVIGLTGDLGAGKTQLVKGLARGLGIQARVQSPTFALVNVHSDGRLVLFHLDLYRLDTPAQIAAAGLDEYLNPAGVAVIEWAERLIPRPATEYPRATRDAGVQSQASTSPNPAKGRFRWVQIESISETERQITYEDFGD